MSDPLDTWNQIPENHPHIRAWAALVTHSIQTLFRRQRAHETITARLIREVRELRAIIDPAPPPAPLKYGVSIGHKINTRTAANQDAEIQLAVTVGAKLVRVERPTPTVIGKLAAANLEPYAVLRNNGQAPGAVTVEAFAAAAATFATDHPAVTYLEIMGQPERYGWNPDLYLPYLEAAYVAIKDANPDAVVVHAGIAEQPVEWYARLYELGGSPYFDLANVHCYGTDPWPLDEVRATMDANGDTLKPLVVSEAGVSLNEVTAAEQAGFVTAALGRADGDLIPFVLVHCLVDDDADMAAEKYGMVTTSGTQRPSFAAFQAAAL